MQWDDGLEGAARCIAEKEHSPFRVLAGPGTGKTFALMRRVARLLQSGADPKRILVCTFTRTAASDLKKELSSLGVEGVQQVRAGTLHSNCFRILSRTDVLLLTGRVPRPLLHFEERFLLEDLKKLGDFGGIRDCEKRLEAFNAAWARLQTDEPGWPTDATDSKFHGALQNWLCFHEAILLGELVPETLRYLCENPASEDRNAFDHVLIDEYQDLNRAEQVLLDYLSGAGTSTVIGDEDQSIYSFKHAHPEGIANYHESHPGTHDESLHECRRCPSLVVKMANHLIANNTTRAQRTLLPLPDTSHGEVYVVQWRSLEEEASGTARFIHEQVEKGVVEAGRVLVLAPRRRLGYMIRDGLRKLGTYALSFFHEQALDGNPKDLEACPAQQAFTLLTLLAKPDDRVALRCWCGFGSPSLRSGAWSRLRPLCEEKGYSPWDGLQKLTEREFSFRDGEALIDRFTQLRKRLAELNSLQGMDLVDALFPTSDDWTDVFRAIASYLEPEDFSAGQLREALRAEIAQPELPTEASYVRVMSLHKSKGLTADLVVVVGCVEGLIPFIKNDTPPSERQQVLEEQRRLFYVSVTRTTRMLVLSSVTRLPRKTAYDMGVEVRDGNGPYATTIASRFLNELGPARPKAKLGGSLLDDQGSQS